MTTTTSTSSSSSRKLPPYEAERIASHIRDCQKEIDSLIEKIHEVIHSISTEEILSDSEAYDEKLKRIRRLQSARHIMREQILEMDEVLRSQ